MKSIIEILRLKETNASNNLKNANFDIINNDKIQEWFAYQHGYKISEGRNGTKSAYCKNEKLNSSKGISQTIYLNQQKPIPLLIRGWSKAKNVSGSKDQGYSIYVDIVYQDDTPLWGQTGNFSTGTHDWEQQEFVILPNKPVKQLTIYGLFRNHSGEVWFDDFEVIEFGKDIKMLDTIPIEAKTNIPETEKSDICIFSEFDKIPYNFIVRDVAKNSDYYGFVDQKCEELDLKLDLSTSSKSDHISISGKITDITGQDRAITIMFILPIDAISWKWHDDIRHSRIIEENNEYTNLVNMHTGTNGMISLYPLACISNDKQGLAIALDMDMPAQYRIGYNSYIKAFFIAYDFGLARETDNFPSSAPFKFVIYKTDPKWGFRSAIKKLYELFPDYFVCRSKDQGIWMPFTDVSTVEGWEDFGFKYHEGINNVPFDDSANILSFRYTEPSTWWMQMDQEVERTDENIIKALHQHSESNNPRMKRSAEATIVSGSFDAEGRYQYQVLNTPWCNGAVFSLNPNPYIPGKSEANMEWNDEIKERLYGKNAKGIQDGEYLDSLEGYVTADENFRREHFHYVTVPLTFSTSSKKPVIHKIFSVYEFSKWLADDVHKIDKLMFANSVPHRFSFLCPFFDVMGTEMDWVGSDGSWRPDSDEWMNLKRTMCYQKPYLFLMNTRYERFTPDLVEKYFQRSLFYGMFPSMFSHNASEDPYWHAPDLYNRDRHLFKRYIPIIKMIAEAGWEPITNAITDSVSIYIERFGEAYFTLMNDSANKTDTIIEIKPEQIKNSGIVTDLISGDVFDVLWENDAIKIKVSMQPEQVRLLSFK